MGKDNLGFSPSGYISLYFAISSVLVLPPHNNRSNAYEWLGLQEVIEETLCISGL